MASFVENVNKLSLNIDTIVNANYMFDDNVLPVLQEVADLDLQEVTEDFKKGNYLGNRKIDIDLSLNKLTPASIVSYSKADITLVSGSIISIPFLSGSSVLELTSHNDIRNYIVNDALWAGIQYTECTVEEATDTTPTLIRFRDADGHSSNIERVELTVDSGTAKDIKPVYFWAQTTSALQTIANRVGDIIALGNNIGNVIELSQRIDELNELQAELTSLLEIHANLAEILEADTNAGIATTKAAEALASKTAALQALSDATTQATIATNQAIIATTKANEIKSITTQTATGAAGSLAQVSYNSTDGKLSFVVPQGLKGDRGEAFSVNAMGTFAQRTGYDAQPINFSYFATDASLIYFKQSATNGDWSTGIPFGKGDTGDTGLTGNGISTIARISGTGVAGSADTYRITYTSGGTFDFSVWNGTESVISVAGKSGTVTLVKADVGLGNVDNTTDLLKPLSTATINALALKADDSTVVHKTGDETIAGVKTFSSNIVGNITGNAATATVATLAQTADLASISDVSNAAANTTFVYRAQGNLKLQSGVLGNVTLTQDMAGQMLIMAGTPTLPPINTIRAGSCFYLCNSTAAVIGIALNGNGMDTSYPWIRARETLVIQSDGGAYYRIVSRARNTASSFSSTGYVELETGIILQWGSATDGATVVFPIAFPNAVFNVTISPASLDSGLPRAVSKTLSGFEVNYANASGGTCNWYAIGY